MFQRGGFIRSDILVLSSIMFLIVGLTIWSSEEIFPTAFAVVDCVDVDEDGYYAYKNY